MKLKKTDAFKKLLEKEALPNHGICCSLEAIEYGLELQFRELFSPWDGATGYWGYSGVEFILSPCNLSIKANNVRYKITPLRQTLLMLADEVFNS